MTGGNDKPRTDFVLGDDSLDLPFDDGRADSLEYDLRAMFDDGFAAPVMVLELSAGDVVAKKYRIETDIARGGMGQIFRCHDIERDVPVALKVMNRSIAGGARSQRRFKLEAKNASSLQHENSIRVVDYGVDHGVPYMVMEYVEGLTVAEILKKDETIAWRRVVTILEQVLLALEEAHGHERIIIHRDIKPSNILVTDKPDRPDFVKVLDFGVSRALEGTAAGSIGLVGSPKTMAPEQWEEGKVSPRTDLYAVGCTGYEMLSGRPVFEAASPIVLGYKHIHETPPPLRDLVPDDTPEDLIQWIGFLMAKKPEKRPRNCRAALNTLAIVQ